MQELSHEPTRVGVRWMGGLGLITPRIRVLVDGECAGQLNPSDQRVQPFLVAPGFHQVGVRLWFWKSETHDVNLSAGEIATFTSGVQTLDKYRLLLYTAIAILTALLFLADFPLTSFIIFAIGLVALKFSLWRSFVTPGVYLNLRRQADPPLLEDSTPGVRRRSGLTIQRSMLGVAMIAVVLAACVWERRLQHQTRSDSLRKAYRVAAARLANQERQLRNSDARLAEREASTITAIEGLSDLARSGPEQKSESPRVKQLRRTLAELREQREQRSRIADSFAREKQKYLDAAAGASDPLESDLPRP